MKRSKALSIGDIIEEMIESSGMREQYEKRTVEKVWPAVVGPSIAAYTRRVWLEGEVLHVQIASASLKEELGYMRDSLVEHINNAVGRKAVVAVIIH